MRESQTATCEIRQLMSRVTKSTGPITQAGPVRVSEQMAIRETKPHLGPRRVWQAGSNVGQLFAVSNWHGELRTVGGQLTPDRDGQRTLIDGQGALKFVRQGNCCVMQMSGFVGQTLTCDGQKDSRVAQLSNCEMQLKPVPMGPAPPPPPPPARAAKAAC
jgi:hypothetical protein